MSDFPTSAFADSTGDGTPSRDPGAHLTLSPTGPQRPEAGSALERMLSRQSFPALGAGRLLGFVPAQVR